MAERDSTEVIEELVLSKKITCREYATMMIELLAIQPSPTPEQFEKATTRLAKKMSIRLRARDALKLAENHLRSESIHDVRMVARELFEALKQLEETL